MDHGPLTRALAMDLAAHGITVNCLVPGWIISNMTTPEDSDMARSAATTIPVGRVSQPADIAAAVALNPGQFCFEIRPEKILSCCLHAVDAGRDCAASRPV